MVRSRTCSGAAWWQLADPAALLGVRFRHVSGVFLRRHGGEPRLLSRRILRDRFERVAQHRFVISTDRTDIGATPATGDDAGTAQNALPEIEAVLRAHQLLLLGGVRLGDDAADVLAQLGETVRRAEAIAGWPIACPMPHRIRRTGLQTSPAARAQAHRAVHLLVAGDIDRTEHG